MPGSVSLTGDDVVTLNGRVFHDFAAGSVAELVYGGDLVTAKPSKNGNIIYALNVDGKMATMTLLLLLGSSDDQYLNSLMASQLNSLAGFTLVVGSFVKQVGDGNGNITNVVYNTIGGVIERFPDAKTDTSGSTDQSVAKWVLKFGQTTRAIM
jgi:hypothetical protein